MADTYASEVLKRMIALDTENRSKPERDKRAAKLQEAIAKERAAIAEAKLEIMHREGVIKTLRYRAARLGESEK